MFRFLNPFLLSSDFDASFSEPEEPVAGCGSVGVSISTSAVLAFNNLSFKTLINSGLKIGVRGTVLVLARPHDETGQGCDLKLWRRDDTRTSGRQIFEMKPRYFRPFYGALIKNRKFSSWSNLEGHSEIK